MPQKFRTHQFRLKYKTRALIALASRLCGVPEAAIADRCMERAMLKSVTARAKRDAESKALKIGQALTKALDSKFEDKKFPPSGFRFKPEVSYTLGVAARVGTFTELSIFEKVIESEVVAAAMEIATTSGELSSTDTGTNFAATLKQGGLESTPYPNRTSSMSKRFHKLSSPEDALGMTRRVSHMTNIGGVNLDKLTAPKSTKRA